jgi:hypothetical protein
VLLATGKEKHSYPICWRCKNPIIFRATEQWFIASTTSEGAHRRIRCGRRPARRGLGGTPPGAGAHPEHDRHPSRLVHPRQRLWGRAHPPYYRGARRRAARAAAVARRGGGLRQGERRRLVRASGGGLLPPAPRPTCSGTNFEKERDILASGSTRPRTRACSAAARNFPTGRRYLGERPAPRMVPLLAAHRGGDPGPAALQEGHHPRVHRGRRRPEDLEEPRQRRGHPEADQHLRGRGAAPVGDDVGLPGRHELLQRDAQGRGRGLPQDPQHVRYLLSNLYDFDPARGRFRT